MSNRSYPSSDMTSRLAKSTSTIILHEFQLLPQEIRDKIWHFLAVANQHIIQVFHPTGNLFGIRRAPNTPVALYVCHDARAEALKVYSLRFSDIDGHGAYFNPDRDTLDLSIISSSTWLLMQNPRLRPDLRLVQSVILHPRYINSSYLPPLNPGSSTIGVLPRPIFAFDRSWMQDNLRIVYGVRGITIQREDFEDHDAFARDRLMRTWAYVTGREFGTQRRSLQVAFLSTEDIQAIDRHLLP